MRTAAGILGLSVACYLIELSMPYSAELLGHPGEHRADLPVSERAFGSMTRAFDNVLPKKLLKMLKREAKGVAEYGQRNQVLKFGKRKTWFFPLYTIKAGTRVDNHARFAIEQVILELAELAFPKGKGDITGGEWCVLEHFIDAYTRVL